MARLRSGGGGSGGTDDSGGSSSSSSLRDRLRDYIPGAGGGGSDDESDSSDDSTDDSGGYGGGGGYDPDEENGGYSSSDDDTGDTSDPFGDGTTGSEAFDSGGDETRAEAGGSSGETDGSSDGTSDPFGDGTTGSEAVGSGGDDTRAEAGGSSSGSDDATSTPGGDEQQPQEFMGETERTAGDGTTSGSDVDAVPIPDGFEGDATDARQRVADQIDSVEADQLDVVTNSEGTFVTVDEQTFADPAARGPTGVNPQTARAVDEQTPDRDATDDPAAAAGLNSSTLETLASADARTTRADAGGSTGNRNPFGGGVNRPTIEQIRSDRDVVGTLAATDPNPEPTGGAVAGAAAIGGVTGGTVGPVLDGIQAAAALGREAGVDDVIGDTADGLDQWWQENVTDRVSAETTRQTVQAEQSSQFAAGPAGTAVPVTAASFADPDSIRFRGGTIEEGAKAFNPGAWLKDAQTLSEAALGASEFAQGADPEDVQRVGEQGFNLAVEGGPAVAEAAAENPRETGQIAFGAAATAGASIASGRALGRLSRVAGDRVRTAGGTKLDLEDLTSDEVVRNVESGGADGDPFPGATDEDLYRADPAEAVETQAAEKTPDEVAQRFEDAGIEDGAVLKKTLPVEADGPGRRGAGFETQPGDYESPGAFVSPDLSPYFLDLDGTPDFSLRPGLPSSGKPSGVFVKTDVENPRASNLDEFNRELLDREGETTARTKPASEVNEGEIEAVIPPETEFSRLPDENPIVEALRGSGVGSDFYVTIGNRRVPLRPVAADNDSGADVDDTLDEIGDLGEADVDADGLEGTLSRSDSRRLEEYVRGDESVDRPAPVGSPGTSSGSDPQRSDAADSALSRLDDLVRGESSSGGRRGGDSDSGLGGSLTGSGGGGSDPLDLSSGSPFGSDSSGGGSPFDPDGSGSPGGGGPGEDDPFPSFGGGGGNPGNPGDPGTTSPSGRPRFEAPSLDDMEDEEVIPQTQLDEGVFDTGVVQSLDELEENLNNNDPFEGL